MRRLLTLVSAFLLVPAVYGQFHTILKPKTTAAFEQYRSKAEAAMGLTPRYAQLSAGETKVEPASGHSGAIDVPGGMVRHWAGSTLLPNTTPAQVIAVLQNYSAYKNVYSPEIVDSRMIARDGNRFQVFLKVIKAKVITAVLHTNYDVEYEDHGKGLWRVLSRSTRIAEVEHDKELPPGDGFGFLWRLNAYWLVHQRGADTYVECRSLSLTRDIPFGAGFVIRPFVTSLPVESLRATLAHTVQATKQQPAERP